LRPLLLPSHTSAAILLVYFFVVFLLVVLLLLVIDALSPSLVVVVMFSSSSVPPCGDESKSPLQPTSLNHGIPMIEIQQRLVHLYHATHCEDSNGTPPRPCRVSRKCAEVVQLLRHTNECTKSDCEVLDCTQTKLLVEHQKSCNNLTCQVCSSVNETKKRKQQRQGVIFCVPRSSSRNSISPVSSHSAPPTPPPLPLPLPPHPSPMPIQTHTDESIAEIKDDSEEDFDFDHLFSDALFDIPVPALSQQTQIQSANSFQAFHSQISPQQQQIVSMNNRFQQQHHQVVIPRIWQCYRCVKSFHYGYRYHCELCRIDICAFCMQTAQFYNQYLHEHYLMLMDT
jgi:hypothetical protein